MREGFFVPCGPTGEAMAEDRPPFWYDARLAGEIERHWQERWEREGTFQAQDPGATARPKFYLLDFFPYPSGIGLHVGHPLGYIGTDVFGRYQRMTGRHVLHPFGFVTFRRHADVMRRQLRRLGLAHDHSREIMTSDPSYYRWTQWIFLCIFNSWYDPVAGRARPVTDLIAEYASGRRVTPDGRPWRDLTAAERADAVDAH